MTKQQQEARDKVVEILLTLPWSLRKEVCSSVKHNGIFCFSCGWGSREIPNDNCQCWNDE